MRELKLQFVGIDEWNRPVFKHIDSNNYFGDIDNLFRYGTSATEVLEFYNGKNLHTHLCYFGNEFGCEPDGCHIVETTKITLIK